MLTARIQQAKDEYVNNKPSISYERARSWTESYKQTEGQPEALCDEAPERRVESVGGVFAVVNVLDDQPFGGQPGIFHHFQQLGRCGRVDDHRRAQVDEQPPGQMRGHEGGQCPAAGEAFQHEPQAGIAGHPQQLFRGVER